MDTALDYVGLAATMGLSADVLAQLLSGGSANRQLYHGMTMATAVGIATGVGSMVAKASHDYVLPHILCQSWPPYECTLCPGPHSVLLVSA